MYTKLVKRKVIYFMAINTIQGMSRESNSFLVVIKLCDNFKGSTLTQGPFLFFVFDQFVHLRNRKYVQKERNEKNGFLFYRNEKKNEFVFKNWNGIVELLILEERKTKWTIFVNSTLITLSNITRHLRS